MMEIRRATLEDLDVLITMAAALSREDSGQRDPFANSDWVETEGMSRYGQAITSNDSRCFLAVDKNLAVGYISGKLAPPDIFTRATEARIGSLYVSGTHRGQQIGERLVEAFLAWARERGADRATVSAFASNHGGLRFYERVGFRPLSISLQHPLL